MPVSDIVKLERIARVEQCNVEYDLSVPYGMLIAARMEDQSVSIALLCWN